MTDLPRYRIELAREFPGDADDMLAIVDTISSRHEVAWTPSPEIARDIANGLSEPVFRLPGQPQSRYRNCLTCRAPFWSEGRHNRMCGRCRAEGEDPVSDYSVACFGNPP